MNLVDAYNTAEREAMKGLNNRQIEASGAVAFGHVGYPVRVTSEQELWRYADIMQEHRAKLTFDMLGGLTDHEFSLVSDMTYRVTRLSEKMGQIVTPRASLLRAMLVYRQITALFPDHASILEIGPGSGYVSGLLAADTYQVYSVEVAQAFALWQRALRNTMPSADWIHVPWWDWIDGRGPERLDVITANHCMNEMHPNALAYLIRRAEKMLGTTGILLFESLGSEVVRKNADTLRAFVLRGWTGAASGHCVILKPPGCTATLAQATNPVLSKGWADLVALWDGEPETADERFLAYCEGK